MYKRQEPKESEKISYSWQYENLHVMEWALGLIEGPLDFPDHFCDVAEAARILTSFHSMRELSLIHILKLDRESRRVFIKDKEINLTAKEFDLLELLVTNPNKVYSRRCV